MTPTRTATPQRVRIVLWIAAVWTLSALDSRLAVAYINGIASTQFVGTNACNDCHSGGARPTVLLVGPTQVAPSSTNVYTLTIETARPGGGLNVRSALGVMSIGGDAAANTRTVVGAGDRAEITHTMPKAAVNDVVTFTFQWTAPSSFTSTSLIGWGNAVNLGGTSSGDRADSSVLMVANSGEPPATTSPTATDTPTRTGTPTRTATVTATMTATQSSTRTMTPTSTPSVTRPSSPTQTATAEPSTTLTATESPTVTATSSPTSTPSITASRTPTGIPSSTPSVTASVTPTNSPAASSTPTASETVTASVTPTATATHTATPIPFTATATASATASATPIFDDADANCDAVASAADLPAFLAAYLSGQAAQCDADVDGDGMLTADDLDALIERLYES